MFFDLNQMWCGIGQHKQVNTDVRFVRAIIPVAVVTKNRRLRLFYDHYHLELIEHTCRCCKNKSYLMTRYDCYKGGEVSYRSEDGDPGKDLEEILLLFEDDWRAYFDKFFIANYPNTDWERHKPIGLVELAEIESLTTGSLDANRNYELFNSDIDGTNHIKVLIEQWVVNPELSFNFCKHNKTGRFHGLGKESDL